MSRALATAACAVAAAAATAPLASAEDGRIDLGCSWSRPSSYGCPPEMFPINAMGTTGETLQMVVNAYNDVVRLASKEHFDTCNFEGHTVIEAKPMKGAHLLTYTFNQPGTYYLTSTGESRGENDCTAGLRVQLEVTGSDKGENEHSTVEVMAPEAAHAAGGDGWEPFGKGVYHDRQYDQDLHNPCPDSAEGGTCLDREESRGSCYYAGEDFHIGHAVFCDVTEVECCGYIGCSDREAGRAGKFPNGTGHMYYWYAPGYASSRSKCCHCAASCDLDTQEDTCTFYDVTSPDCQREPDKDSLSPTTIGFLKCAGNLTALKAGEVHIREVMNAPAPDVGRTSGAGGAAASRGVALATAAAAAAAAAAAVVA